MINQTSNKKSIKYNKIKNSNKWNFSDWLPYILGVILMITFSLFVINISNKTAAIQKKITLMNEMIINIHKEDSNIKQDISYLINPSRLNKIAQKSNLKLNIKNIRDIK